MKKYLLILIAFIVAISCNQKPSNDAIRSNTSGVLLIDSLSRLAEDLVYSYKYRDADKVLEDLLFQSVRLSNSYGQLKYHLFKGLIAYKQDDVKNAIRYLNHCVENARSQNLYIYTDAFITLGDLYSDINNFYLAHGYYLEGLDLAIASNNNLILRHVYSRIGLVLFRQKQFIQAREYFVKSLDIYKNTSSTFNDFFKMQELINNIGLTYFEQKDYNMAMEQYKIGLAEINRLKTDTLLKVPYLNDKASAKQKESWTSAAEGVVFGNIGRIFLKINQLDSSEFYLKKSIEINLEGIEANDATLSLLYLMELYLKKSDYTEFKVISTITDKAIRKHGFKRIKSRYLMLMSHYYYQTGNYKLAYENHYNFQIISDSLNEISKEVLFTDIPTVYLLLKRSNALELLEKDAEFKNWQNRILIALVIFVFLSLIFIGLYFLKERKIRTKFELLNSQLEDEKKKLKQANKELEILNKEKTMILGVVAHDLRNPINIIKGFTELLSSEEQLSEFNKKSVYYIQQACDKSLDTINDLVEIARFGLDMSIEKEEKNVIKLIQRSVDSYKNQANEKGIRIELAYPQNDELKVMLNEVKFQRVIDNLLSNAIKFTVKGGAVTIEAFGEKDFFVMKVIDNGVGIPADLIPKLFDRFTKAGRYGTAGEKSLGLGMSIVKTIVELHGGKINVESEVDKGTTFTVSIPL